MHRPPRLLAITGPACLAEDRFVPWLRDVAVAGVDAVQLRAKELADLDLYRLAVVARETLPAEVRLLVNGRADVALAAGADGVHLPGRGVPVELVRRLTDRHGGVLIGCSTHDLVEVAAAAAAGADYVVFGPVYGVPDKGAPVGVETLRRAADLGVPVLALGGVDGSRLAAVAAAGAVGAAGIRAFAEGSRAAGMVVAARRAWP